ncbi:PA2169 family four-helix-bundle protein [Pseudoxanthomonas mexicana]|uniref:PA2169 family four-helix-bundle protein n=1 Tax=Pseudoxanthomonas mexicana TaxID=128785 RepID=UPI00398B1619
MNNENTAHTLNDLIAIARDGKSFYEEAAQKVDDAELKNLFTRIAGIKGHLVTELGAVVQAAGGTPEDSGTLVGSMQKMYGNLRATLGDKEYGYVAQLEESEDRLINAFNEVAQDSRTSQAARDVVTRLLPEVRASHDVMRNRKLAMKSAA